MAAPLSYAGQQEKIKGLLQKMQAAADQWSAGKITHESAMVAVVAALKQLPKGTT